MHLSLQAMLLNSIAGNIIVFVLLALTALRFYFDVRGGLNGMTKALFWFFLAMTIDRLVIAALVIAALVWLAQVSVLPAFLSIVLVAWGFSLVSLIIAWVNLKAETRHG